MVVGTAWNSECGDCVEHDEKIDAQEIPSRTRQRAALGVLHDQTEVCRRQHGLVRLDDVLMPKPELRLDQKFSFDIFQ